MKLSSGQMASILEEVNYKYAEPVLVKCLAVHNEAEWVEYNLANCYDEFDIIRVVEGAVQGRPNSTSDGHSTDRTLELIRNFPDPENKIELITQNRFFKSLEEQKQTFLDLANEGEWLMVLDCDEFYMEGDVERVREAIRARPTASEIIPTFLHFYRDFNHIKAYHPEWNLWHQRIIRYRPGLRYHTHPVATDGNGQCTYFSGAYQSKRYTVPRLWIYHYGHAKGKEFHAMKQKFYESELEKFKLADGTNASDKFDEKFVEFMEGTESSESILEYDGPHPAALDNHPSRHQVADEYVNCDEFENWQSAIAYTSELPTIPQWMLFTKKMEPVYNVLNM